MNYEVKHKTFNPTALAMFSPLAFLCEQMEQDRWELVRVIYHSTYEAVAVFQRLKVEEVEEEDDGGTEGAYL